MEPSEAFSRGRRLESGTGTLSLVFGGMLLFLAVLMTILWAVGRSRLDYAVGAASGGLVLLAIGLWLRQRTRRADAPRIEARLYFGIAIVLPILSIIARLMEHGLSGGRAWMRLLALGILSVVGIWFYLRYVRRESRQG
jgi:hypothetical protein